MLLSSLVGIKAVFQRWLQNISASEALAGALTAAALIFYFYQELFLGLTYLETDQLFSYLTHMYQIFSASDPLEAMRWNRNMVFGHSYTEAHFLSVFRFPDAILFRFLRLDSAVLALNIFNFSLALISTYSLTRIFGFKRESSLLTAVVFVFSGIITSNYCHQTDTAMMLWLPVLLLGLEWAGKKASWTRVFLFTALFANNLSFGHLQFSAYVLLAVIIYFFFRKDFWVDNRRLFYRGLLLLPLGLFSATPYLLPVLQQFFELRGQGISTYHDVGEFARNPLSLALLYLAPSSIAWDLPHLHDPPLFQLHSLLIAFYVGCLPVIWLLIPIHTSRIYVPENLGGLKKFAWILVSISWLMFLAGFEFAGSSLLTIINKLPFFGWFHHHTRIIFLGSFGMALLAGITFERILADPRTSLPKRAWAPFYFLLVGASVIWIFDAGVAHSWGLEFWGELSKRLDFSLQRELSFLGLPILLSFLALALLKAWQKELLSRPLFVTLIFLHLLTDLLLFAFPFKRLRNLEDLLVPTPITRELQLQDHRLLSISPPELFYARPLAPTDRVPALAFSLNQLFQVQEVGGFVTPSLPQNHYQFFDFMGARVPLRPDGYSVPRYPEVEQIVPLARRASVSHLLLPGAGKLETLIERSSFAGLTLYQLQETRPRVSTINLVHLEPDNNSALMWLEKGNSNLAEAVVVASPQAIPQTKFNSAEVKILTETNTQITLQIENNESAFILLTDRIDSRWRAYRDGRELPIFATDGIFRGAVVPPGKANVEFIFQAPLFEIGLLLRKIFWLLLIISLFMPVYSRWCQYRGLNRPSQ